MIFEHKHWEIAEQYINGTLSIEDEKHLKIQLAEHKDFEREFQEACALLNSLKNKAALDQFTNQLKSIATEEALNAPKKRIVLPVQFWKTAAIAASVAFLASVALQWWSASKFQNHTVSKYNELKRVKTEIEGIKKSQNQIIKDLNDKANKPAIATDYSGTGFAVTNDGYLITNYHVTKDADSIYIQTKEGYYYKASILSFDEKADIALLKVEKKNFKFSTKNNIPYTFNTTKSGLGERVYSLGYPQDEVVYQEGYISSKNGYLGDSMQYRLELPAEPGQSGSPLLNSQGNIVGMLSGKASNSEAITYAVSSATVLKMIKHLPQNISLPKVNKLSHLNRQQQIEKLQDFTVVVNVYK